MIGNESFSALVIRFLGDPNAFPNKKYADSRYDEPKQRDPKRALRPEGHFFLSCKITLSLIIFVGGLWLVYIGFQRTDDVTDLDLKGIKYQSCFVVLWALLIFLGAGMASGVVTYWLSQYAPSAYEDSESRND